MVRSRFFFLYPFCAYFINVSHSVCVVCVWKHINRVDLREYVTKHHRIAESSAHSQSQFICFITTFWLNKFFGTANCMDICQTDSHTGWNGISCADDVRLQGVTAQKNPNEIDDECEAIFHNYIFACARRCGNAHWIEPFLYRRLY